MWWLTSARKSGPGRSVSISGASSINKNSKPSQGDQNPAYASIFNDCGFSLIWRIESPFNIYGSIRAAFYRGYGQLPDFDSCPHLSLRRRRVRPNECHQFDQFLILKSSRNAKRAVQVLIIQDFFKRTARNGDLDSHSITRMMPPPFLTTITQGRGWKLRLTRVQTTRFLFSLRGPSGENRNRVVWPGFIYWGA